MKLQGILFMSFLLLSTFLSSATSILVQVTCSEDGLYLPQPEQVNAFLAQNESLVNPLPPSALTLQGIRCRCEMTGPSYEFYQVADEKGCKSRPGMRLKKDDEYTPQEKFYLSQVPFLPYVNLGWTIFLVFYVWYFAVRESRREHPRHISEVCCGVWCTLYSILALVELILGGVNPFKMAGIYKDYFVSRLARIASLRPERLSLKLQSDPVSVRDKSLPVLRGL